MERGRWIAALGAVTWLVCVSAEDFQCAGLVSHHCSCSRGVGEYELICPAHEPNLIVNFKQREYIKLVCTSNLKPHHWNRTRTLLSGLSLGRVDSFLVRMCPGLPDYPFKALMDGMGVPSVDAFHLVHMSRPIDRITRNHLSGLESIRQLDLNTDRLTYLPEDLFVDLKNLTWLDLKNNRVVLPRNVFRSVPGLEVLELGSNNLTYLEPGIFRNLTRLRLLNLWGNRLQNLSRHVFTDVPNIESLDLNSNGLTSLAPDLFADLANLKSLNLFNNDFISLPRGLFLSNPKIEKIQINHNRRSLQLPPGLFSNLKQLKGVKMNHCNLTSIPEDMFWGSPGVTNLSLKYNLLTDLPEQLFRDSKELLSLDLSYNWLTSLSSNAFRSLTKLDTLNLSHNNITTINQGLFSNLGKLRSLNMENNFIQTVSQLSFSDLPELRIVNLACNNITNLKVDFLDTQENLSIFFNCVNLEELNLSRNKLSVIYDDWKSKSFLRSLDLSYNNFSYVTFEDMSSVSKNLILDLNYNKITTVNMDNAENHSQWIYSDGKGGLVGTDRLENRSVRARLRGNPIVCDCRSYDLIRFLRGEMESEVWYLLEIDAAGVTCGEYELSKVDLRTLTCASPDCPSPCECRYRRHDQALLVDCSNRNLTRVPGPLPSHPSANHTELDLSYNSLGSFSLDPGHGFNSTTRLYLSNNRLTSLNISHLNPSLEMLALDNNNLTRLDEKQISFLNKAKLLRWITLYRNPWTCDCKTKPFLHFLHTSYSKIGLLKNVTCRESGESLSNLSISDLCPNNNLVVGLGSLVMAVVGLVLGGLLAFYYRYQREIKVWLYAHNICLWFVTEEELDKDKQYDAFISYSHEDEGFVNGKLVPSLETDYKLCLHYRDWVVGDFIPRQIAKSVEESRRTVVVVSPAFLDSVWGKMEFRTAHQQALTDGRTRVIVILYGDVGPTDKLDPELRSYLAMNTYIKWGDPWFWDRLRYALPHPAKSQSLPLHDSNKANLINGSTPSLPPSGILDPPSKPV